jgi:uncharacterized protein
MNRILRVTKHLGLLALGYVVILAGTYIYCELAEPPGIRVDQAAKPLLSPQERAALHPDTRAGLEAYDAGDYTRAHDLWLPRAEAGDAEAMFRMGRLYDRGEGVEQSFESATSWFRKSTTQSHKVALFYLALYARDKNSRKDDQLANQYYRISAQNGFRRAAFNLAVRIESGVGAPSNEERAFELFEAAAVACHPESMHRLSNFYFDGILVPKNRSHSYKLSVLGHLNGSSVEYVSNVYWLFILAPWQYVEAREKAWVMQVFTCAQDKLMNIKPD